MASGIHNNNANKRNSFHRDVFQPVKASPPSYSDILKNTNTTQVKEPEARKKIERGLLRIPSSVSDENKENNDEEVEEKSVTTKKKKNKKKSTVETQPQRVKKSKEALTLDFADVVEKMLESSKTDKKTVIRTGGILPAQAPIPPKEIRNSKKNVIYFMHKLLYVGW
ncbi:uncharacterized protein LOC124451772 [Xenia sp. Carnegie-2017]|uniref:uncharacterized protein LOC124451772 n=1 Tax=Xenia sp. Carnegie-2017 TaxID=2897299 RepID=UPI001F0405E1|nr:uncharacterized protein LOC124451772 [Xenia sp. Carnegie-2017]